MDKRILDRSKMEEQYIDLLTGRLPEVDEAALLRALDESADAKRDFEEYRRLFEMTQRLRSKEYQPRPDFSQAVMDKVLDAPRLRQKRLFMSGSVLKKYAGPTALAATGCAAALLATVTFVGREATQSFPRSGADISVADEATLDSTLIGSKDEESRARGKQDGRQGAEEVPRQERANPSAAPKLSANEAYDDSTLYVRQGPDKFKAGAREGRGVSSGAKRSPTSEKEDLIGDIGMATGGMDGRDNAMRRPESKEQALVMAEIPVSSPGLRPSEQTKKRPSVVRPPSSVALDQESAQIVGDRSHGLHGRTNEEQPSAWQNHGGSGETYSQFEENPRTATAIQPVSTFSIDVDTGSYTNVRRFLRNGQLPPRDSVRIEEFLNYFDYKYPTTDDGKPFTVNYEMAPSPLEKDRFLLKVGIKAKAPILDDDRGWNLVFLVDVSGSMADEDKLPLLKESMKVLVDKMRPIDRLAIVTYAGGAGTLLESTPGSEKSKILSVIDSLSAGGSTNGSGGINAAYEVAEKNRRTGGVNRVILATDGDFNVGVSSFDGLVELIEEKRKSGITLTSLGVGGGNYNERNLEQLANKGNGNYFYLDTIDEARRVLGSKLVSNIDIVAKDVKLQLEFNPANVAGYRLIGYDNRRLQNQDFNNDAIDAGEVGAGHTVTALYEVILNGSPAANELVETSRYRAVNSEEAPEVRGDLKNEIAFLKIRYKQPNGDTSTRLEFPIEESKVIRDGSKTSRDFRFAAAVSYFGHILRGSRYTGSYTLAEVKELALGAIGDDLHGERKELVQMIDQATPLVRR